ncbi:MULTISPECIES: hypothetical protein [unclassified Arthrobacter]|uniref:hypothetical protein n=1 Tax=unclassified Arthrobacter TaxID=235627 RepID=UPI0027D7FFBC|nr:MULTISPECIES: hypothetical protein [unclassified Arthrobacter]
MLTLPAAPPPVESVVAARLAAWQRAVPAGAGAGGEAGVGAGVSVLAGAVLADGGLAVADAGWLGVGEGVLPDPQPLNMSAAAAAAVSASPF